MVVRVFLLYILLTWIDVYVFKLSLLGLLVASSHHQWLSIKALTGIWTYIKLIVASTVMLWFVQILPPLTLSVCMYMYIYIYIYEGITNSRPSYSIPRDFTRQNN